MCNVIIPSTFQCENVEWSSVEADKNDSSPIKIIDVLFLFRMSNDRMLLAIRYPTSHTRCVPCQSVRIDTKS